MSLRATILPVLMALLGAAMIVRALAAGGGVFALGVVMGALFLAIGVLRLWAERRER